MCITPFPPEFPFDPFKTTPKSPIEKKFHEWLIKKYGRMGRVIVFVLEAAEKARPRIPTR